MGVAAPVEFQDDRTAVAGSAHSDAYRTMLRVLVEARHGAGLSQAQLAGRLGKPPSFVGKYELGERRLDVIELLVILRTLERGFEEFWSEVNVTLPDRLR